MSAANLLAQSCNNPKETFMRFRDFMCKRNGTYDYSTTGIGWTLHDSSYAVNEDTISVNDYFVMYSAGEDGLRNMYFKIQYVSGYINILGFLYWNAGTHAGVHQFGAANSWTNPLDTNNILWVYGDLDAFCGIAKYSASYNAGQGGWCPDSPTSQEITTSAGAITAGSSVIVSFTAVPAEWAVGTKLFVRDTANIERVNISAISGTDVTFTTFVASYSAGCTFCLEENTFVSTQNANSSHYVLIDHSGAKNGSVSPDNPGIAGLASGSGLTGKYPAKKVHLSSATTLIGPLKNQLAAISTFTSETTHTLGADGYRFFNLYSARYALIKEV